VWSQFEAKVSRMRVEPGPEASTKEVLMSSLKSAVAILEQETNTVIAETEKPARPMLVPKIGKRVDDNVTRRVEAALDVDFANGRMPA